MLARPRLPPARWLLVLALLLPVAHGDTTLERVTLADGELLLNGAGIARQLNEELYVALLYVSRPSANPDLLFDARQRRRLQLRLLADRMYPSGVARHFRDLVSLNNPRDEIVREAKNLNRFYGLFQHGLMRGDELLLDSVAGKGLQVRINGQTVAEFGSPLLFDLLLRCFIGDKPPNLQFRSQLLGEQDSAGRSANLARFAALTAQDERRQIYATVDVPARTPDLPTSSATPSLAPSQPEPAVAAAKPASPPTTAPTATAKAKANATSKPADTASNRIGEQVTAKPVIRESESGKPDPSKAAASEATLASAAGVAPGSATDQVQATPKRQLSSSEIGALLQRYESQLREQLNAGLEYPRRDMKRKYGMTQMARQKGEVVLRLHLDAGGDINAAWLQQRTNEPILDNAALALVDKLAPFPPLPAELPESAYEFYVTLEFDPDR